MWIRSQDKETLVKVEYIDIDNGLEIGVMTQRGIYDIVGTFKSKKRALEVLDEIQNYIKGYRDAQTSYNLRAWNEKFNEAPVYEMPKE